MTMVFRELVSTKKEGCMITIRSETPQDLDAIRRVNLAAFPTSGEADLVDALRARDLARISLVAEMDGVVIGHIFFSPVTVVSTDGDWSALGLAPLAVLPEFQNQGIGSTLVQAGLEVAKSIGEPVVFLLGHPEFYPRFGFKPADQFGIYWEIEVPPEAFMLAELVPGAIAGRCGEVHYQPEFKLL